MKLLFFSQRCNIRSLSRAVELIESSGWSGCREVYSRATCRSARALWRALRGRLLFGEEEIANDESQGDDDEDELTQTPIDFNLPIFETLNTLIESANTLPRPLFPFQESISRTDTNDRVRTKLAALTSSLNTLSTATGLEASVGRVSGDLIRTLNSIINALNSVSSVATIDTLPLGQLPTRPSVSQVTATVREVIRNLTRIGNQFQ